MKDRVVQSCSRPFRAIGAWRPAPDARLGSLLDHLNEVVFQTDAAGLWTYLNPAWTEMTGFRIATSIGVSFLEYVHPDDRERNQAAFKPLIEREKEVCRHEVRYLTANGGYRWVEVYARLTLDEGDQIVGTSGTLRDVTERREADEAGRRLALEQGARAESERAREQVERILESMGEGFLALDRERRVTYVNRAAERLLELDRVALLGRSVSALLPDWPIDPFPVSGAPEPPPAPTHFEHLCEPRDGVLHVTVHLSAAGYSIYVRDVTEQRRTEAHLEKRLRVEASLAKVSPLFLLGSAPEADAGLAELGRLVGVSRAYIFTLRDGIYRNLHEWCAQGVESRVDRSLELEAARFPWLTTALAEGRAVVIPDVRALPPEAAAERGILEPRGTRSALAMPVIGPTGNLKGFLGFDDVRGPRPWSEDDLRSLRVAAEMVASGAARGRVEDALRRSEERYRLATRATRDVIYDWDVVTGALERTAAFESSLGHPPDGGSGHIGWWERQVHPDDAATVAESLAAALAGQDEIWSAEYRFRRGDGTYAQVLDRGTILRDERGKALRMIGAMTDATERRAAEDALRASRARLAEAERIAGLGSWEVDLSTGKSIWSDQVFRLFGRDRALGPLSMEGFMSRVPAEDRESLETALAGRRGSDGPFHVSHRIVFPDGTVRHHEVVGEVTEVPGQPPRLVGVSQDVTERRLLEEQYRTSQRLEAVGLLAGGVAHDFNNVLSAVSAAAELAKGDLPTDSPVISDLDEILDAVRRGAALTRQLLGFSGKRVSQPARLDPNALVADLQKMLKRLLPEDVRLDLDLAQGTPPVFMDPGQLEQVVMNLVINARDAMASGGLLQVATAPARVALGRDLPGRVGDPVPPGAYARLTVSDTGHGMDAKTLKRVFDPFFTTKAPGKGTGLGLATVLGIVRDAHGGICVRSAPEEGTVFDIYLPVAQEVAEGENAVATVGSALPGGGETILVVDDEPTLSRLARRLLETRGYHVLESNDPLEALRVAKEHHGPIHLLFSDVVMPGLNGVELSEQLRADRPELGVLFMSGHVADSIRERGVLPSRVTLLEKPLSVPLLLRSVRIALDEAAEVAAHV